MKERYLIETLDLPKDICLGMMNVRLVGNCEVWIENYKGILKYTEKLILIQGKKNQLCIEGNKLSIVYYGCDDMKIQGIITNIKFIGG